jgi:AcrR family transcriptional regulator
MPPRPVVQPPLQDRSRRTLDRIAGAVEELLATRAFDDIAVADIVRQARCSTSSFYARFASKDDVLPYLYARYDADLKPRMQARAASVDVASLGLREAAQLVVDNTVDMYAERRHLLRAVALYARTHPRAIGDDMRRARAGVTDVPATLLARFATEIAHDDPSDAARTGFFIVAAVAREKVLFGEAPHATDTPLSNDRLKRELGRMLFAYLTCP